MIKPKMTSMSEYLIIKEKALDKITSKYESDKEVYLQSMEEKSRQLMKKWNRTYKMILRDEEREKEEANRKVRECENLLLYKQIMDEKRKEREKIIADAKEAFFKQKDEPRQLESALMCAEMLKEQQAQREFNKKLKEEEKLRDKEYNEWVRRKCEEWKREQIEKRRRRIEKDVEESMLVKKQAERHHEKMLNKKKEKLQFEKEDYENARIENEKLDKLAIKMKKEEQEAFKKYCESAIEEYRTRKAREDEFDKKENELLDIYRNVQFRLQDMRNRKEKEILRTKTKIRDCVRNHFQPDNSKIIAEEERLKKVQKDLLQIELKMSDKEAAATKSKKEERIKNYTDWLEQERINRQKEDERRSLDLINRFENIGYTERLHKRLNEEFRRKTAENMNFIKRQQDELAESKRREKSEMVRFYNDDKNVDMKAIDEKFLGYADQLMMDCKAAGRPTLPLQRVINDYKSRYMPVERNFPHHQRTDLIPAIKKKIIKPENRKTS